MKRNNRYIATLILFFVTAGFLASYPFNDYFAGRLLAALFGAAMIGGIADWFGITALFRKPLGIPFRTEIIPKNREKIFDSLVNMVENELLTKEALKTKLEKFKISEKLIYYMDKQGGKNDLTVLVTRIVSDILERVDPKQAGSYIEKLFNENSDKLKLYPMFLNAVEWLSKNGSDERVVSSAIDEFKGLILYPGFGILINDIIEDIFTKIKENTQKESPGKRLLFSLVLTIADFSDVSPSKLSARLLTEALEYLNKLKDPNSKQRLAFSSWLEKNADELSNNPEMHDTIEKKGMEILKKASLSPAFSGFVYPYIKNEDQMIKLQSFIDIIVQKLIDDFKQNSSDQAVLDSYVKNAIVQLIEENHPVIGKMVRQKLELFSNDMLVDLIEEKAGNDLQIIRINGSIVGGFVGMLIFLITYWIK